MKNPNFFILGAPKCGTTSLAYWLSLHPDVYMAKAKEPHYFNKDHSNNIFLDFDHYMSLFKDADSYEVVGEASVWYLYSKVAVKSILATYGSDVKYLVMLRNPVDMAHSLYEQQVYNFNEDQTNFQSAWNLQESRMNGKQVPKDVRDLSMIMYGPACKLGEQVERLIEVVPRKQIQFVFLKDMLKDTVSTYRQTLRFLDLVDDDRIDFPALNTGKARVIPFVSLAIKRIGLLKQRLGLKNGLGIMNWINSKNKKKYKREPMSLEFRKELEDYFRNDIDLLEKLVQKDLSQWKTKRG